MAQQAAKRQKLNSKEIPAFRLNLTAASALFSDAQPAGAEPIITGADGALSAKCFRYPSGVAGIKLCNTLGSIVVLPFQGQQIWDAEMLGRRLTMRHMYSDGPQQVDRTKQWGYIDTYGCFFTHCGADAMGCPGKEDTHLVHGDLPNALYQKAHIAMGSDARGHYLEVGGEYRHTVAFTKSWVARPKVRLYAGESTFPISIEITNAFHKPMDLMYMAHTNWLPREGSSLVFSHPCDPATAATQDLEISPSVNGLVPLTEQYSRYIESLKQDPAKHASLTQHALAMCDPEILIYLRAYRCDAAGHAHSMQLHLDGTADYVRHSPAQLPKVTRWMVVDGSHAALGMCLPGTAEPTGKASETAKGNLQHLQPGASVCYDIEVGALDSARAKATQTAIAELLH